MGCKPVPLVVVLAIYGVSVVIALTTVTVMFSVINEKNARASAIMLVNTTMGRNLKLVGNYLSEVENMTEQLAQGLSRFGIAVKERGDSVKVEQCIRAWKVMTIPLGNRAEILSTHEMWRADKVSQWRSTGCITSASECYLYSPDTNTTSYVKGDFKRGNFSLLQEDVLKEVPPYYTRHERFLNDNDDHIPDEGLWSPMYISEKEETKGSPRSSRMLLREAKRYDRSCVMTPFIKTMTFYLCMDILELDPGEARPDTCLHVIAISINAHNMGDLKSLQVTTVTHTFVMSAFIEDERNSTCFVPNRVQTAYEDFLNDCDMTSSWNNTGNWTERLAALDATCQRHKNLLFSDYAVTLTAGWASKTGVFLILVDIMPRSFFFGLADRGKHVSIAISVTVCIVVVVVSIVAWLAIVLPIRWICHGLRKASTLTSEPKSMERKAARYTFIREVDMLYKSYLELRQALTELKAFVPQGLFVAPSTQEMYSDAMLMALFGPSAGDLSELDNASEEARKVGASDPSSTSLTSTATSSSSSGGSDADSPSAELRRDQGASGASATSTITSANGYSPASAHQSHVEVEMRVLAPTPGEVAVPVGSPKIAVKKIPSGPGAEGRDAAKDAAGGQLTGQQKRKASARSSSVHSVREGVPQRRTQQYLDGQVASAAAAAAANMAGMSASTAGDRYLSATGTGSIGGGIVHVFPISQTESILRNPAAQNEREAAAYTRSLLKDAGLLEADSAERRRRHRRHQRKADAAQSTSREEAARKPNGAKVTSPSGKDKKRTDERRRKRAAAANLNDSTLPGTAAAAFGFTPADQSSGSREGGSPTAASLELNLNHSHLNTFRHVSCSFLMLSFSFRYVDTESLEAVVTTLMDTIVKVILRCGGVIEVFRPDLVAASFGAHATMNRHAQFATLCGVTLMRKIPAKQRPLTRIIVDSGVYFVGNCGAHGRTARVVFGDRVDFSLDLMKYDLGLGRVICTDRVASMLPSSFVVPVDYIVPLRNRVHGIQLFQILNPARRHDPDYRDGANRFRIAYGAAVSGDLHRALAIVDQGQMFDAELAANFRRALMYLLAQNPPRPRYCRFQLPQFELLGSQVKERSTKYMYEKLALEDISARPRLGGGDDAGGSVNGNDTLPSINFGLGDPAASATENTSMDTLNPESLSRAFFHRGSHVFPEQSLPDAALPGVVTGSPNAQAALSRQSFPRQTGSGATGLVAASSQQTAFGDNVAPSGESGAVGGGGGSIGGDVPAMGGFFAMDASLSSSELPMTIVDLKGESWFRMPKPIGTGAFAEVYKALSSSGTVMALKCIQLLSSNVQLADVVSEVNTACKLFNDHIVNYAGWAHVGSYLVIIMDFIAGGSLHAALTAFPRGMPVPLAKRYASDALKGLAYLHRNGIVHADIKPQNILLSADGACKLGDFGSSVTKANALLCGGDVFHLRGTAAYMSPEVAAGSTPTLASDLWSFGITLFEMLTGRLPWKMRRWAPVAPTRRPSMPENAPLGGGDAPATLAAPPQLLVNGDAAETTAVPPLLKRHDDPNASPSPTAAIDGPHASSTQRIEGGSDIGEAEVSQELVEVQGVSDVRFVQGLANGSIVARVYPEDLPTPEAFDVITRCLRENPTARPSATEIVDHVFFLL